MNKAILFLLLPIILIGFTNYSSAESDQLVVLETSLGDITIEFFPNDAPNHVENFINLSESGFYDGVIFHRIIPGFMIQSGDPNTIAGDPSTWGTGGPSERVNAEFNTIKHNRGIVSMARSADPNSGGSQFFIVHQNSNFLDGEYTVFGRIVTDESLETLDEIASVETRERDIPTDIESVRVISAKVVSRSEVPNILELPEPERTLSAVVPSSGNREYRSTEHNVSITVPEGWFLQTPDKTGENSPDIVAVGPRTGAMNPVISLTVQHTNQRTFDQLISEKDVALKTAIDSGNLNIISKQKKTIDGLEAYEIHAEGHFSSNGEKLDVKFKEVIFYDSEKYYTLAYSNGLDDFASQLPQFEDTISTFALLSNGATPTENQDFSNGDPHSSTMAADQTSAESVQENGGCLIATATFGSELATQVQQLREIRDSTLLSTASGTAFMSGFNQLYYSFSPTVADLERKSPMFKELVKISITPMLSTLSIMEHAESESQVLGYGIGVILMNLGIYFIAPAIAIFTLRDQIRR